ncbi:glycosyltransferase family 4 protein [Noviherbaspirillum cavernae]|uniref:glycosyltransferase family 4 protein n=1 Tax=Noviherbaspirillum cavernae TaxID=2320862 RepID=UPI001F5B20C5|nr:glycosyltransferase family 4 protein [Noviherbaspirillum cavernae]
MDFHVIFCSEREPNRLWDLPPFDFPHTFLRERFVTVRGRYIHHNPDVISHLKRLAPDVVVTDGFNPTHLYAFAYAVMKNRAHAVMTDGTDVSEQSLSRVHKGVRRIVYARSHAFIAASQGGVRLYESYGIPAERCFMSCLCIDNGAYAAPLPTAQQDRPFDFIFSGRIEAVKNPLFALEVAAETARRIKRKTSILFAGSGSMEGDVRAVASRQSHLVDTHLHGHAAQGQLPALYGSARLFLFPTLWDPWGVVANEACAAGLPVITTPAAGVAGELVRDSENGFVCTPDVKTWAQRAAMLLTQDHVWRGFSRRSLALVDDYSYDKAAEGLMAACRACLSDDVRSGKRNLI